MTYARWVKIDNNEIVYFRTSVNAPDLRDYAEATTLARAENLVSEVCAVY